MENNLGQRCCFSVWLSPKSNFISEDCYCTITLTLTWQIYLMLCVLRQIAAFLHSASVGFPNAPKKHIGPNEVGITSKAFLCLMFCDLHRGHWRFFCFRSMPVTAGHPQMVDLQSIFQILLSFLAQLFWFGFWALKMMNTSDEVQGLFIEFVHIKM